MALCRFIIEAIRGVPVSIWAILSIALGIGIAEIFPASKSLVQTGAGIIALVLFAEVVYGILGILLGLGSGLLAIILCLTAGIIEFLENLPSRFSGAFRAMD
jgi:hypothetical protein